MQPIHSITNYSYIGHPHQTSFPVRSTGNLLVYYYINAYCFFPAPHWPSSTLIRSRICQILTFSLAEIGSCVVGPLLVFLLSFPSTTRSTLQGRLYESASAPLAFLLFRALRVVSDGRLHPLGLERYCIQPWTVLWF